jgi:hypothetical protein
MFIFIFGVAMPCYVSANFVFYTALFHKKHFKVPRGAVDFVYVCNKCLPETENIVKVKSLKKNSAPKNSPKKKQKKQSRRVVARRNQIVLKYRKKTGKKGKRGRPRKNLLSVSKNETVKVPERESSNVPKSEPVKRLSKRLYDKYMKGNSNMSDRATGCRKRMRTPSHYSYWSNGLLWTPKPDDERARSFRNKRIVFPSEDAETSELSPVCSLCDKCYSENAIYVACEKCEGKQGFYLHDIRPHDHRIFLLLWHLRGLKILVVPFFVVVTSEGRHDLSILVSIIKYIPFFIIVRCHA